MKKSYIIIIVGVVLLGAFIMLRGSSNTSTENGVTRTAAGSSIGTNVLAALGQLDRLTLDDSVFKTPVFRSLKNFSREIQTQPVGKSNPFASSFPISQTFTSEPQQTASAATSTATSTKIKQQAQ